MDNTVAQKIKDYITRSDKMAIAVSKNPTVDEMAASLALYLSLSSIGKKVSIASPTEPIVELSNLVGIDKVQTQFSSKDGDLIVSFPYKEGEIEKVSYTLEDGLLNIIVKASQQGLSFQEQQVRFKRGEETPKLLFVVGTSRISDLGKLYDTEKLKDSTVINIDNKSDNQGFGEVVFVSPSFSSVSEQMAVLLSRIEAPLDVDIAQNILSGIIAATGNFQRPSTSLHALEQAARMMRAGAVRQQRQPQRQPFVSDSRSDQLPEDNFFMTPPIQQMRQQSMQQPRRQPQVQTPSQPVRQPTPFKQVPSQPIQQSQSQQQPPSTAQPSQPEDRGFPEDWLTPKVYKGSTSV